MFSMSLLSPLIFNTGNSEGKNSLTSSSLQVFNPYRKFFWCHLCKCCPHECHSHFMKVSRPVSIVYPCWKLIGLKSNLWGLLWLFKHVRSLTCMTVYIKFFLASLMQSPVDNVSSYYAEYTCNLRLSFSKWVNQYSFSLTKI